VTSIPPEGETDSAPRRTSEFDLCGYARIVRSAEPSVDLGRWIVGAARRASLTVALLIGAMLLSLGGTAGSTFATEETGSLYDVGGYRLYLQCSGRVGGPGEQSRRRQDHAGYAEARTG
jgi:hypothetical protein